MHDTYSISILTTDTDLGETNPYPGIPANQWITREPGIRIYYASRKSLRGKLLRNLIDEEKPDFIYLNSMYSFRFSILPLLLYWRKKINAQIILSPRGMLRESAIKFKTNRKKIFINLLNFLQIPERIHFHATDEQERKDIGRYFPRIRKLDMVPNFSAGLPSETSPIEKTPGTLLCVFISRINSIKNIIFFLEILGKVPEDLHIRLAIYGEIEDASYWQEAQKIIHSLPKHIKISYHGPLPHAQVMNTLGAHHVFVLPTKGENFGHAIYEALSAGRPVLISDRTPWLKLREKEVGWDLPLDDPAAWLGALKEAAAFDQETYNNRSANCRRFVQEYIEKADLKNEYIKIFS